MAPARSVLKPLKGVDPDLYENLASLARRDYREFELILGCEDPSAPALALAHRLRREFPRGAIRVVSGGAALGLNPKVNNLRLLAECASRDGLLVSDVSVRADPEYLANMVEALQCPKHAMTRFYYRFDTVLSRAPGTRRTGWQRS